MVFDDKMHEIIHTLENNGIILYPTDTVWALGCSINSHSAIEKIKKIKGMQGKPMVILASNLKMLKKYVPKIHPRVETLLDYHEKPLTVVYPQPQKISKLILAVDDTVAIRIPKDPFCITLIDLLGNPIVSTIPAKRELNHSLNYADIDPEFLKNADYICQHRRNIISHELPSVMVRYDKEGELDFLRS